ncbi:MAG: hypothetical protein EOP84_30635, partial [Verrucomicrobiaceae bacterium]
MSSALGSSSPGNFRRGLARLVLGFAFFAGLAASRAGTVTAHLSSPSIAPVVAAGFSAAGDALELSLGFAPAPGLDFRVVDNTGLDFISGRFSNLQHGQVVTLSFGGATYQYVANYYGGTGNDLVLHRTNKRLVSWGRSFYGQLGNGCSGYNPTPAFVNQTGFL